MSSQQGILIVLSGPSGTGKGTICRELLRSCPDLYYSVSATTRTPRPGEVDGVNYYFLSQEQFRSMIQGDDLLEWAEVYGNYYGTPRQRMLDMLDTGKNVVLEIDTQGAMQVKQKYEQGVFIYIVPPSLGELAERIHKRGTESMESIHKRMACVKDELACAGNYHYIVVNDQVETAVDKIAAIITAEKCRYQRNQELLQQIGRDQGQPDRETEYRVGGQS